MAGIDTYGALSASYAKDPANVEVVFKLAQKSADRYSDELTKRSNELYQKVLTMDLGGRTASYYDEDRKATIPYVEAAEFALAQQASNGRKADPAPLRTFIAKHPASVLAKSAYSSLSYYYGYQAKKEDAQAFFDEALARYPDDKNLASNYLARIIRDKDAVDKGLALAEKLKEKQGYPRDADIQENLAQLYVLKDDPAKADEEYGKDFADGYVSNALSALTAYATFWIDQGKNLESAEEMADIAAAAVKAKKDAPSYYLTQVAMVYGKLNKDDKAIALYGPDQVKKGWDDQMALYSYASFWTRQGKNLESAAEAARRSVELKPDYFNNFVLGQVLFKLKNYDDALAAAERAVELAKPLAAKYEGFTTAQYESLVKQIKEAMAKK
ncbi:MAG TPA: tetratricopeptide repeat protein [Acidobacteriota bacterium]|nr:tetratricopeptide repeat protein [Acidobacteriota bacterium]